MRRILLVIAVFLGTGFSMLAQDQPGLVAAMQRLSKEKNPKETVSMIDKIINEYKLDKNRDAETLDVLYGTAAVNFAMNKDYSQFEKFIGLIQNKFNQTSFMNMAASKMLDENVDAGFANKIAQRTLTLYESFRYDTTARPKDFSPDDWSRFMNMAQYPYYDTYAHSLFELNKYDDALHYQKMAFMGSPEEGLPPSVERYTKLLALAGKKEEAKQLLLKLAGLGKLNKGMTEQLQSIYISERGSDKNLGAYLDSLQKNVQATLVKELTPKMLNEKAPAFTLKDINGKEVELSDYSGKIVVLDLWATWCVPCIKSFPAMQIMVKKHPEVAFLFIAVQEREANPLAKVKGFIEKGKYPFKVLIDEPVEPNSSQYKILSSYKPDGIPAKYIIDKNGTLRFTTSGFDTDTELMNELEAMFSILKSL